MPRFVGPIRWDRTLAHAVSDFPEAKGASDVPPSGIGLADRDSGRCVRGPRVKVRSPSLGLVAHGFHASGG